MNPNIKVFVGALRAGKSPEDAFAEYCWAKLAVPIRADDLEKVGDPVRCPPAWTQSMAEAMGAEAFDAGKSDEEIAEAFETGLSLDRDFGILWRTMRKEERPTPGDLARAMGADERAKAAEVFGVGNVARMLVSR